MAHHKRPGGRSLELLLLLGVLVLSIIVVGAALLLPVGNYKGGSLVAACLILAPMWKLFLGYYKYDASTLQPLNEDKEKLDDSKDH